MSDFNSKIVENLRANEGVATIPPFTGARLAILHTRGARSGAPREHPLAFSVDGDAYVVVASKGGADDNPAWYHNLVANPEVELELGPRRIRARARSLLDGEEYERLYERHAEGRPGFWEYRRKTSRKIPVVVLQPID